MPSTTDRRLALADLMILVAMSAAGAWGVATYKVGLPIPIISRPELPVRPFFLSIPVAAALTWAFILIPVRTLRERIRRLTRQPGTALCIGAAAAMLAMAMRWSLRIWIRPYVDGTPFIYGARLLYDYASWCGLGGVAALAPIALCGRPRHRTGWVEKVRLGLGAYWIATFLFVAAL